MKTHGGQNNNTKKKATAEVVSSGKATALRLGCNTQEYSRSDHNISDNMCIPLWHCAAVQHMCRYVIDERSPQWATLFCG